MLCILAGETVFVFLALFSGFFIQCVPPTWKLRIDDYARFNTHSFWIYLYYLGCILFSFASPSALTKHIIVVIPLSLPSQHVERDDHVQ